MPRDAACVSVFDSSVQGGDAVWEGLRVYRGRIFQLDEHLDRLADSAKAMAFASIPPRKAIKQAIFDTLQANGMRDGVHIRLTLTRGKKTTSGMDPRLNQYGPTLIVLAEWKPPVYSADGIRLVTSAVRRNTSQCLDSKIHHNNLINNILAKIEANVAGVDDAVMLDIHGFVSETNATNIFFVKRGVLLTPHADSCLPGITRGMVIELARANDIPSLSATCRWPKCTLPTRCSPPARWANCRLCYGWTGAPSATAQSGRSPAECRASIANAPNTKANRCPFRQPI